MTTNNLPETWTIARDDMGRVKAMLECEVPTHRQAGVTVADLKPRAKYEVFIVGCRGERFVKFVNALGCYSALRKAGKDCRLVNVDLLDGESDGLSELEREQVEAVP